jgi:hypothetical protein
MASTRVPQFSSRIGYSVSGALMAEPWNLWTDRQAVDIFCLTGGYFAER